MENKRPAEVSIMAFLTILLLIGNIIWFILQYILTNTFVTVQKHKEILMLGALIQFVYIFFLTATGYGLLKMNEGARRIALFIIIPTLLFVSPAIEYSHGFCQPLGVHMFRIVFSLALLIILTRPKVKEQFK